MDGGVGEDGGIEGQHWRYSESADVTGIIGGRHDLDSWVIGKRSSCSAVGYCIFMHEVFVVTREVCGSLGELSQ